MWEKIDGEVVGGMCIGRELFFIGIEIMVFGNSMMWEVSGNDNIVVDEFG